MEQAANTLELKGTDWYLLLPALTFEPDTLTVARFQVRNPYSSAHLLAQRFASAASKGLLESVAQNEYRLTDAGRRAVHHIIDAAYAAMATLARMPSSDLERLTMLLRRIVTACENAPEPPGKWCLVHSRRTDPGKNASVIARIDQYLSDLNAYRDDAHLAAWQPHGVSGHAWEVFTFIWRGDAPSLDELYEKLQRRGHSRDVYAQALGDLTRHGWISEEAGKYRVTQEGQVLRQEAEDKTDRYFYAPWACLSERESEELRDLLTQLRDGLR
jgi:hypothetical protein